MQVWSWWKLGVKLLLSPREYFALRTLPRNFTQFEDWHKANLAKAKITASLIGCRCIESLEMQEEELMRYRQGVCDTATKWFAIYCKIPEHSKAIDLVCKKYAERKECHREFSNPTAGVWCYCDEHSH